MIIIRNEADAQRLLDLALTINEKERCSWTKALRRAVIQLSHLDQAQAEPIEVHESWSIPPRAVALEVPTVVVEAEHAA